MKSRPISFGNSASPIPPGEGKAPTVAPNPQAVGAAFSSVAHPGKRAAVSTLNQPCAVETAAANSELTVPVSETGAATAIPGSASPAVAALLFFVRMNIETLRVSATKLMCATSSSA